jgi:ribosomal protein L23
VRELLADHEQNEVEDIVYEVEVMNINADRQDEKPKRTVVVQGMEKKKDQRDKRRVPT